MIFTSTPAAILFPTPLFQSNPSTFLTANSHNSSHKQYFATVCFHLFYLSFAVKQQSLCYNSHMNTPQNPNLYTPEKLAKPSPTIFNIITYMWYQTWSSIPEKVSVNQYSHYAEQKQQHISWHPKSFISNQYSQSQYNLICGWRSTVTEWCASCNVVCCNHFYIKPV